MISVIVSSRVEGNINSNLNELIRSLADHSRHPQEIELLVKFDNDDKEAAALSVDLANRGLPFHVYFGWGDRGRGYIDIHHGYNQLLPHLSKESNIVIAMADDFRAERDWDNAMRNAAQGAGDFFIIHQRPHPVPLAEHMAVKKAGLNQEQFNLSNNMFEGENLYIIDEAPAWSPMLLQACWDVCIGHGEIFPVSFTDAWTLCLEYALWHDHGLNITKYLPDLFVNRKTCEVDQPGNPRWHTDRKENFEFIKSIYFKNLVSSQAKEIACRIKQSLAQR